jgi:hypothetical protein
MIDLIDGEVRCVFFFLGGGVSVGGDFGTDLDLEIGWDHCYQRSMI